MTVDFPMIVAKANLAPSVHNIQPARWRQLGQDIEILCDTSVELTVGDRSGRDAALSCGAAVEATIIALSEHGFRCEVEDRWHGERPSGTTENLRSAALLRPGPGTKADGLARHLDRRFTHRGLFSTEPQALFGWTRPDTILVTDAKRIARIAGLNDAASLKAMKDRAFRRELVRWMRFSPRNPRFGIDGMSRDALRMSPATAFGARLVLGPLWGICAAMGLAPRLTAEADATVTATAIALFHRPLEESPITSGRAYLRLWLEATALGFAGWPMAALADDAGSNKELCVLFGIGADRQLIQAIRFGKATEPAPPRARRPVSDLIV